MCLICYFNMKTTLITAQFPLTHFAYVHVKIAFQTAGDLGIIIFHTQCILVNYFSFLCPQSQLDKDVELFSAQ